ncbi:RNA recognition family related protein [Cyclospora cayetanensis]|uniref:RNA recognition family related protein n=1 Tax=Cyclospora cayetanensis TaxID=88456 RepID=A0A1D3D3M8_9EIME|nr:RNA recognition family related protein [Cyclospora cayetanensis]
MGAYYDPRGPPVPSLAYRERDADWGGRGYIPMGGPRPYGRDARHIRRGPPIRDEGPVRRQQPNRGLPTPTVDRYKSQSRSLSEEGPVERGSSAGSPPATAAAAATRKAADGEEGDRPSPLGSEGGSPSSPNRGSPSSLPLHSRVGDLRRRLQSKRVEPPSH